LSAYQIRFKQYQVVGIAAFGEAVDCKVHGKHDVANAELPFAAGMWLGRDSDSGEHLIATYHGVV
jgi:hypothetical protein